MTILVTQENVRGEVVKSDIVEFYYTLNYDEDNFM